MRTRHRFNFRHDCRAAWLIGLCLMPMALVGCAGENPGSFLGDLVKPLMMPTPQQAAQDAFNVYDADKRRRAVDLIAASPFGGQPPYVRMYRLLITDPDATVRAACARALAVHGTVDDAVRIMPLLRDKAAFVRWEAARALQRIHNPAAVGPLINAAQNDEDADVRMAAAGALGQYAQPAVVQVLIGALNDTDFGVVRAAHQSLHTLTGQSLHADSTAWLNWADANHRDLFAAQRKYTYQPYDGPPGFLTKIEFWHEYQPPQPRPPIGLGAAATQPASSPES